MRRFRWLLWVSFFGAWSAQGASFDCGKAETLTERTVCATKELSALDDELGRAYREALRNAPDKNALREDQKEWLEERDRCGDDAMCIYPLYQGRIATLRLSRKGPFRIVRIDALHADWVNDRVIIEMCSRFAENLNSFPAWPPMLCERKLNPEFTEFSRPQWRTWSAEELRRREPLFSAMVSRREHLKNEEDKRRTHNWWLERARQGEVTVQEARAGVEIWARYDLRRPEETDAQHWEKRKREALESRRKLGMPDRLDTDTSLCGWHAYVKLELAKDGTTLQVPGFGLISRGSGANNILVYRDSTDRVTSRREQWSRIEPDWSRARLDINANLCVLEYRKPVERGEQK